MPLQPLAIHEAAQDLLDCVCVTLDDLATRIKDYPGCPTARRCLVPGLPAWDSCEDPCTGDAGGQLTVNLSRMYASTDFPAEDHRPQNVRGCVRPLSTAVELVVTVLRCAPGPTEDGCPPSCEDLEAAATILDIDAVGVFNAITCCLAATGGRRRGRPYILGRQQTLGPQGGCVGVEQRVTIALPGCGCPQGDVS
ncbi:hypothetical protein [Streptomyces sp. NPDC001750]|uniref:hypothetical protein n=1 Tax=Streptomyces sp. NPDC001750 TaxID=3364607 RepID=UPI0036948DF9